MFRFTEEARLCSHRQLSCGTSAQGILAPLFSTSAPQFPRLQSGNNFPSSSGTIQCLAWCLAHKQGLTTAPKSCSVSLHNSPDSYPGPKNTCLPSVLLGNDGGGVPWGGRPLQQVQSSQATEADVWTLAITDFHPRLNFPCCMVWRPALTELGDSLVKACFAPLFPPGFQLVLSVGRGLLLLVTLMFSAGFCTDGLWPHWPLFAGVCPCQSPPRCAHTCQHSPRRPLGHPASFFASSLLPSTSSRPRSLSQIFLFLKILFIYFRERRREGEKEGEIEKH